MNYDEAKAYRRILQNSSTPDRRTSTALEILALIELDKIIDKHEADQKIKEHLEKQKTRQDVDF